MGRSDTFLLIVLTKKSVEMSQESSKNLLAKIEKEMTTDKEGEATRIITVYILLRIIQQIKKMH